MSLQPYSKAQDEVVERVRVHRHPFDISAISQRIWQEKYQLRATDGTPVDATIET